MGKEGRQTLREKKNEGKKSEKEERKMRGSMAGVEMRETERRTLAKLRSGMKPYDSSDPAPNGNCPWLESRQHGNSRPRSG